MARQLVPVDTCDHCKKLGLENVEATRSLIVAIDGPPKRFEFCDLHLLQLQPLWEMCHDEDYGVDESLKPKKRSASKQPPKEVEQAREPEQQELPSDTPEQPPAKDSDEDVMVTCSLPHPTGKDATVKYRSRNSHAKEAHDGAKVWEIKWGDPAGALTHLCTRHKECQEVQLAFPSQMSLSRHVRMCPLEKLPEPA